MAETSHRPHHDAPPPQGSGRPLPLSIRRAAKWPPDDDDAPGAPMGGGAGLPGGGDGGGLPPGGGNYDERDLKKKSPVAIIIALIALLGGGAAIYFAMQRDEARLTPLEVAKEKDNIFVLPLTEQVPKWRTHAAGNQADLRQEALAQLAYLEDAEAAPLAAKALESEDHAVKGVAAQVLAYVGSPKGDVGKGPLLAALQKADDSDRPQIVWALVTLKEPQVFQTAMDLYRKNHLTKVQRLGGGNAFDPTKLAEIVSLDEFAKLSGDESPAVRQLVATVLSRNAEPKWTSKLVELVKDKDVEVAREAASGLGRIADESARGPLLDALKAADKDSRKKFLEALRDGIGGEGLVLALQAVPKPGENGATEETVWFQTKQLVEMVRDLADPRAADALVKWAETPGLSPHWKAEAGIRLAEIGDVRAAPLLAERMKLDPTKLYAKEKFWEADEAGHLSRNDTHRVVGSRMLADLAALHPDKRDQLLVAEEPVLTWASDRPQPHANALRFLATIKSEKALPKMREWAFPKDELPKEGAQPPFPTAFETAQSALRYIGRYKDEQSFQKLLDQYDRKKDKKMDITQDGLMGAGLAMLGMSLRAVAYGASQGLAEWGDPRAVKPMMELIEDETWHEEARLAACEGLAWCAEPKDLAEIAKRAKKFAEDKNPKKQLIGACYAVTLSLKPAPEVTAELTDLLSQDLEVGVRFAVGQAIGAGKVDDAVEAKLFEKLKNPETRTPAGLALVLGGDREAATRAVASFSQVDKEAIADLKDAFFRALGFWSDEDFKKGNIYRWVDNAEAIARIKVHDAPQVWAAQRLSAQFDNLKFDNGPHSETRVVLRYRLIDAAKNGDDAAKAGAIRTLKFMKEKGSLLALRHEKGKTGELAGQAYHELMNPRLVEAEDLSALQQEQAEKKK